MGLTSHSTAMDLMIQGSGNGVVPRQRFGQIPQLLVGASSEQGAQAFLAHREVVENLQHIKQDRERHGVQNNGL